MIGYKISNGEIRIVEYGQRVEAGTIKYSRSFEDMPDGPAPAPEEALISLGRPGRSKEMELGLNYIR